MADVIWFIDRFGIRGEYLSLWAQLLHKVGIKPTRVKQVSLHAIVGGQLLTRHKSRKAPTWVPDKAPAILAAMSAAIKAAGPDLKAVVLGSPESLAVLNLDPDYATLGKLRGSVYTVDGVPAIVILPMSTWHTQVSQKDIAAANYGMESGEQLAASSAAHVVEAEAEADDSDGDGDDDDNADSGDDEDEDDSFFYVPVIVPVGKFYLQADTGKLGRIVNGQAGSPFPPIS